MSVYTSLTVFLVLCMLDNFAFFLTSADFFSKSTFFKENLSEISTRIESKSFDPD